MIKYALACELGHGFEGWFGNSVDYDDQSAQGLVQCPLCGSASVRKQIMSPAVVGTKQGVERPADAAQMRAMMMEALAKVRAHVEDNFDYVGDSFAREARDIHDGKSEERGIYGEASPKEVRALLDDGIEVAPLPPAATAPKAMN